MHEWGLTMFRSYITSEVTRIGLYPEEPKRTPCSLNTTTY